MIVLLSFFTAVAPKMSVSRQHMLQTRAAADLPCRRQPIRLKQFYSTRDRLEDILPVALGDCWNL